MRYIYSDSKLICIDNISVMEIVMGEIIITLNSGKKGRVYASSNENDVDAVFKELVEDIRCNENDIDMWEFQCHMKFYCGVEDGTWFI